MGPRQMRMMKDDVIGHLNPNGTFLMVNHSLSRLEPDSVAVRGGIGSKFKAKHYPHAGRENPDRKTKLRDGISSDIDIDSERASLNKYQKDNLLKKKDELEERKEKLERIDELEKGIDELLKE